MKIGVFTALWGNLSLTDALDRALAHGLEVVEIGAGGLPGHPHCDMDDLLDSEKARQVYLSEFKRRNIVISSLSVHDNPLHPNKDIARKADEEYRKAVRLAALLGVTVVNTFSGCPGGSPEDTTINWITCPWPPEFSTALNYQWNEVAVPYWQKAGPFAADHGINIGLEMHPGMLVYNVFTLLRLRQAIGPMLGVNFDPSHLLWNGVDPVAAIRRLGPAIFHVHAKDVYIDSLNVAVNGCIDNKPYSQILDRSWTFRSVGYGHGISVWKDMMSALRIIGYDHVVSIEHEDALMSSDEGLAKGIAVLREACISQPASEMFWA